MSEQISDSGAFARYQQAKNAPSSLQGARERVRQAAERRFQAEAELDARYQDLDRVTGWNLRAWALRMSGRIRTRQAAAADAVVRQHAETERAVAHHDAAIREMRQAQSAADQVGAAREAAVGEMTGPGAEEARKMLAEAKQLQNAMAAAGRAHALATDMAGDLTGARRWSVSDTYLGGGIASSAMKQEHIYQANDTAAALTDELRVLRGELQASNVPTSYFGVQANDFIQSTDIYWDNIVSDLAMARRIEDSRDRLERLELGLVQVSNTLGQRHKLAVERIDALLAGEIGSRQA